MRRGSTLILLVLVLLAAAVNFPLAMWLDKSVAGQSQIFPQTNLFGAEAAAKPWPHRTPHDKPWPPPTQYAEARDIGFASIQVWSSPNPPGGVPTHQMTVERVGWPFPCVQRVQMWWPWNANMWQTNAQPQPKPSVYWPGALLNPLILGMGAWLVFVAPFELCVTLRRRRRSRRGACPRCGYPQADAAVCPECGSAYATKSA